MAKSQPAHLAPAGFFIIFPVSFITTLLISLNNKHVALLIPYISDTGDRPPESCVFSMMVCLCAAILGLSIYVRHLQIKQHINDPCTDRLQDFWNNLATGFGALSTCGLLLVANFQEDNSYVVHFTGAAICIWGGSFYTILQTLISHLMREHLISMHLHYGRVFLASMTVLINIIGIVSTVAAVNHAPQGMPQKHTVSEWSISDDYWVAHVISVVSEWSLALLQSVIILSFVPELKRMKVVFPSLTIENISSGEVS